MVFQTGCQHPPHTAGRRKKFLVAGVVPTVARAVANVFDRTGTHAGVARGALHHFTVMATIRAEFGGGHDTIFTKQHVRV